jgi:hypothetical protein
VAIWLNFLLLADNLKNIYMKSNFLKTVLVSVMLTVFGFAANAQTNEPSKKQEKKMIKEEKTQVRADKDKKEMDKAKEKEDKANGNRAGKKEEKAQVKADKEKAEADKAQEKADKSVKRHE